jgi:hypothetical protein
MAFLNRQQRLEPEAISAEGSRNRILPGTPFVAAAIFCYTDSIRVTGACWLPSGRRGVTFHPYSNRCSIPGIAINAVDALFITAIPSR